MSILKNILSKTDDMVNSISGISLGSYKATRNEKAELIVKFNDGFTIQLPYLPFRPYQTELAQELFLKNILRHLIERPRRSGKEVESWNLLLEGAVENPGLYLMVYPTNVRARAVLWDGAILTKDGMSIPFLNMIHSRLLVHRNNQEMKIRLLNGSLIWILGSDIDPDKLRGTNPRGIVFAEFAFQDPRVFHIMLPALRQNNGWLICQSTFNGMNHFYQLMKKNIDNPKWYCRIDSIATLVDENGDRYITDEMIQEDRDGGMPEYLIQQEYYGNVEINQETMYFAHPLKAIFESDRIISNLFIPDKNVYSAFDIGMNDCTAIVLFQVLRVANYLKPHVIGYIENNNRDLRYYVDEIRKFCNRYNLPFAHHFIPHDGQKRDFNTGKNTIDFLMEMGESGFIVPRPTSKENAIESIRRKLYLCDFNKENTQRLIDCLSNYSKEYDDKMGIYKSKPVHNWASHGVDAFQTMTLALDGNMISDVAYETVYYA